MTGIKLIAGLGNPGQQYRFTRHNAGAMLVERLAEACHTTLREDPKVFGLSARIDVDGRDIRLLFPSTYMNRSGQSVSAMATYYKLAPQEILLAYDDLDLPPGSARLKFGGGHGGHNGIRDSIKALGTADFHRLRLGIGHPGQASEVVNYVLSEPSRTDAELLQQAIEKSARIIPLLAAGEFQRAMNLLHTQEQQAPAGK